MVKLHNKSCSISTYANLPYMLCASTSCTVMCLLDCTVAVTQKLSHAVYVYFVLVEAALSNSEDVV